MAPISTLLDWLDTVIAEAEHNLRLERGRFELPGATDDTPPGQQTNETAPLATGAGWRRSDLSVATGAGGWRDKRVRRHRDRATRSQ
jgi:hypothetical protein